jgi:ubiquitin thioesterase protein OTUB1
MSSAAEDNDINARQEQDKLTQAQLLAIENEIKSTQPLTSSLLPISTLLRQYSDHSADSTNNNSAINNDSNNNSADVNSINSDNAAAAGFITSSKYLGTKYTSIRKIRGDGNCYYRAFLYALCECLLLRGNGSNSDNSNGDDNNESSNSSNNNASLKEGGSVGGTTTTTAASEFKRIKDQIVNSLKWVCQYGYDEMTIDMFHEELVDLLNFIEEAAMSNNGDSTADIKAKQQQELHTKLNEENSSSDYCTWYLRVLTSAQMKSNPDRYLPFLLADYELHNCMDVPTYCSREVEPMGKECGMVTVAALAECLGVKVVIEYMDGRLVKKSNGEDAVVNHVFGQVGDDEEDEKKEDRICLTLLYRPGHYDILY